ncbi:unnamed protein product [Chilo suppressalis]|uniref:FP protein C-terminal domain-containing protein n=1 Tax=Chilo suppressalis TaxID=168631 RepID=A0ABN8AWW5_CHISP|nr:unnamed protein product [Chilo suppressalis]
MPLNRSPPQSLAASLQHCHSDPNLTDEKSSDGDRSVHYLTQRVKRKRSDETEDLSSFILEMKAMFQDFKTQQDLKLEKIWTAITDIKTQNSEIRSSIDFLSQSHDTLKEQINKLEFERKNNLEYIRSLEDRLEKFERGSRATCLEIRNIPIAKPESKEALLDTVLNIGKVLKTPISRNEVKDVFRIHTKNPENKSIIVDLTSVLLRDKIIEMHRKHYKDNKVNLTTEHLGVVGPVKPVFITENLTSSLKRLLFLSRDFAKTHEYKYCWVKRGKIYLRSKEGAPHIHISSEDELSKLQSTK